MIKVTCMIHGSQLVQPIAPVGPTLTRPRLHVIPRIESWRSDRWDERLWDADPNCNHYITYGRGGGVVCIRCRGWYCS